ncbi:hypothetical protein EI290_08945 [Hymenobacter metallilatus]|uniref:Uncharacterized protein n=1 Tax=Hymenobacter metallilatus TaxID=2493666 RepID=A0A3R9M9D1_9BACT|nr:hypothetical protein EI290_08945 [Hymenobacter metallilatus]
MILSCRLLVFGCQLLVVGCQLNVIPNLREISRAEVVVVILTSAGEMLRRGLCVLVTSVQRYKQRGFSQARNDVQLATNNH